MFTSASSCIVCCHITVILFCTYPTDFIRAFEMIGVQIPKDYEVGSKDPLILDCIYEIRKEEESLNVLKWYFNNYPIYQWIYGHNPKTFSNWKDILDLSYFNASNNNHNDPMKRYKSFRIASPRVNLTGTYKCNVEVLKNGIPTEDFASQDHLTIYEPATGMELEIKPDNSTGQMEIMCNATGIKPQPEMRIDTTNQRLNEEKQSANATVDLREDDTYDIIMVWTVNLDQLTESTTFNCTVTVPNTRYQRSKIRDHIVKGSNSSDTEATSIRRLEESTETPKPTDSEGGRSINVNAYLLVGLICIGGFFSLL